MTITSDVAGTVTAVSNWFPLLAGFAQDAGEGECGSGDDDPPKEEYGNMPSVIGFWKEMDHRPGVVIVSEIQDKRGGSRQPANRQSPHSSLP